VTLPSGRLAALLTFTALAAAGCGTTGTAGTARTARTARTGLLTGLVRTYGGPERIGSPTANGVLNTNAAVTVQLAGGSAVTVRTDSVGRFTVTLPAGTYVVGGCGGVGGPLTDQVVVRSGETTEHDIGCQVP
jgi:hypothetical protein